MAVMSVLSRYSTFGRKLTRNNILIQPFANNVFKRLMSGGHERTLPIIPSTFMKRKFYDSVGYYFFLSAIPLSIMTFLVNIYVGPAELTEIPKDYEPKHWEYYRHPISRFLARYVYPNPQQDYEKTMHMFSEEHEKIKWRKLEDEVKRKIAERGDYKAWYYRPVTGKYERSQIVELEELDDIDYGRAQTLYGKN